MENKLGQELGVQVSMEGIIASIRNQRNVLIHDVLNDSGLRSFLEKQFDTFIISAVKTEFLKRDLKELQNSPLDLAHYAAMIRQMKEQNTETPEEIHPLFLKELKIIFQKYGF